MASAAEAENKSQGPARLSVSLASQQNVQLDEMVEVTGMTKNELVRQAVALLSIVVKARKKGLTLALAKEDDDYVKQRIASTV
jgi:Ribbon-helix-helix protein, copG family